ncbi:long-chain-fatty-acid--CoA ligase FadD19 [Mycobacterium ulcerans str. Harvey]|uniref:Long-chain-fatty-acid--CoA ligase FadD19 n=1 Tax=Mycobacterium ulcerans str. Harvey TaxID=1299332 RepID=A0ABN0QR95_MYCUL|nr:long-chain-fatty-acid--CoA ligase FadD19 [Mycobacterium ulcerans str. Harvey]
MMWRHEDIYRVLFGGTDFATGEFIKDEYDLAKAAAANPPMIRYPIPPMIHGATQSATWMSIFSGQTTVLAPEFDADQVWRTISDRKVNLLFFTGDAMARPLLDALMKDNDYDLSSLFLLASTAALFSPSIKEKLLELLPNRVITDSIGSSETGFGGTSIVGAGQATTGGPRVTIDHRTVVLDEEGNEVKPGSGVRGIIAKKGNIPVGYYKDEKKTAETFKTINGVRYAIPGDYAMVEADGTVTMLGRGSVSINSGGEKIYPEEVEAALKGHPDVFDALVVGVPDPRYGQHVAAVVAPGRALVRRWRSWTASCAARSRDTRCHAASGSSTRSSVHPRASRTTAGPRSRPRRGPPTMCTPRM